MERNQTLNTIFDRASYRGRYKDEPVPREDMKLILKAGLAAPSGCNRQTTSLVAVDEPALLEEIRRIFPKKSLGYDTCWYEGNVRRCANELAALMGAPEETELVCVLPVGRAAEELHRVRKKAFEERAWFNGYGR